MRKNRELLEAVHKLKEQMAALMQSGAAAKVADNYTQPTNEQWEQILNEIAQIIWQQAMEAKELYKQSQLREEIIDNLASTAPRSEFIVNVDLGEDILTANPEATVYLSTDDQSSWSAGTAYSLNSPGYENTWEATISNDGGQNISWYISGEADSEPLGFDYGRILVSQTPFHSNNSFPPPSNHYALLAEDPAGDASSNQDVLNFKDLKKISKNCANILIREELNSSLKVI